MDLTIFDIIKGPWVTAKAYDLNQRLRQLVLEVHCQANKALIADALKKLFNVDVVGIRVSVVKPRTRRVGRHTVSGKTRKKAIVILKDGHTLDFARLQTSSREVGARAEFER